MKLSDIVSAMHLSIYAEVSLFIFLGVFIGVVLDLLAGKERFREASLLPLKDEHRERELP